MFSTDLQGMNYCVTSLGGKGRHLTQTNQSADLTSKPAHPRQLREVMLCGVKTIRISPYGIILIVCTPTLTTGGPDLHTLCVGRRDLED